MDEMEKRRYQRFAFTQEVEVFNDTGDSLLVKVENLSLGGALLAAPRVIGAFRNIHFSLLIPDGFPPVRVHAHVIREFSQGDSHFWGVEFVKILPRDRNRILDLQISGNSSKK